MSFLPSSLFQLSFSNKINADLYEEAGVCALKIAKSIEYLTRLALGVFSVNMTGFCLAITSTFFSFHKCTRGAIVRHCIEVPSI
jgi:hypothetical protein